MYKKCAVYLSVSLLVTPLVSVANQFVVPEPNLLQRTLAQLPQACSGMPASLNAPAQTLLTDFYAQQQFASVWSQPARLAALLPELEQLADDGLNPAGYQLASLRSFAQQAGSGADNVCQDIFISHVYLQALQHLQRGRLVQASIEPFWQAPEAPVAVNNATLQLAQLAVAGLDDLPQAFTQARPALAQYQALRSAYAYLRQQPLPAWQPLASGPTLRPQMSDARVPALVERLFSEGYLATLSGDNSLLFGPEQVAALKSFQLSHALQADGVMGAATLTALNVSPQARREQLRANLERFRWLGHNFAASGVLVNVAAAQLTLYQEGAPVWQTRTQVGRPERATPLLKSQITRLTLNPTWSVPPTIFREDKLPEIRRDQSFLNKHDLKIFDRDGNPLSADQVDWTSPGFVQLRQSAGPKNPLGRVVLRFANPFSVYLHDTPSQPLFSKAPRAFSSGCVRVEQALYLSEQLMTVDERERAANLWASGKTYELRLSQPIPLLMSYWTAEVDAAGQVQYVPDIYHYDPALLAALDRATL